jgi:hypothetical protein
MTESLTRDLAEDEVAAIGGGTKTVNFGGGISWTIADNGQTTLKRPAVTSSSPLTGFTYESGA